MTVEELIKEKVNLEEQISTLLKDFCIKAGVPIEEVTIYVVNNNFQIEDIYFSTNIKVKI